MGEFFTLTVEHGGKEQQLETQLLVTGYTHKFMVLVNGVEVFFEPDEEGSYRAVLPFGAEEKMMRTIDVGLLQKIADTLQSNLA
jgi:hypothetical protein